MATEQPEKRELMTQEKFVTVRGWCCPVCHTPERMDRNSNLPDHYTCWDCGARWKRTYGMMPLRGYELIFRGKSANDL